MLQRKSVLGYIRDVAAQCEITAQWNYTLENALHVFWLPRRIRYTSSDYFGVRVVRLSSYFDT